MVVAVGFLPVRRLWARRATTGAGSGLQRAQSFMIMATLLYRASHLSVGVLAAAQRRWDHPLQYAGLAVALAVSALCYGSALRRGWFDRRHIWADILVTGCLVPLVLCGWGGAHDPATLGWATLLGGSASATAAICLERFPVLVAVALLVVTHILAYQAVGAGSAIVAGHVNSLLSSAVMAWAFCWYLRRQGRLLDDANARALAAEANKARYAERLEHHRALHDTVLATLTTLAAAWNRRQRPRGAGALRPRGRLSAPTGPAEGRRVPSPGDRGGPGGGDRL